MAKENQKSKFDQTVNYVLNRVRTSAEKHYWQKVKRKDEETLGIRSRPNLTISIASVACLAGILGIVGHSMYKQLAMDQETRERFAESRGIMGEYDLDRNKNNLNIRELSNLLKDYQPRGQ